MPRRCISLGTLGVLLEFALAQLEGVRLDDQPRRTDHLQARRRVSPLVTMEAPPESATPLHSENSTAAAGPGSACRARLECPSALVCLSGTCRCPELLPVLLRFENSFACAPSRRLDERCLSHAECSHANEHARCLRSVCSCPPRFYATKASLLCLPESVAWHPVRRMAAFPLLTVLVSAFLALAGLCCGKLVRKRRRFSARLPPRFFSSAPKDGRELRYERFLKCLESRTSCPRLSSVSTTFRFGTDYLHIEARRGAFGRNTETPAEGDQWDCGALTGCHTGAERKRSECCSSSVGLVPSNAQRETGSVKSETFSTVTKMNNSRSGPHDARPGSGGTGSRGDSSGMDSNSGKLESCHQGPDLSRNTSSDQLLREVLGNTEPISQLLQPPESAQVSDTAVTVHAFVPPRLPATAAVTKGRPVPLPRKKIPALLTPIPQVVSSRNRRANSTASVFGGAAVPSAKPRKISEAEPSSRLPDRLHSGQLESVKSMQNEPIGRVPEHEEQRIANPKRLRRTVSDSCDRSSYIRRPANPSEKFSTRSSRRPSLPVLKLRLKERGIDGEESMTSSLRLDHPPWCPDIWKDHATPMRDAFASAAARPRSASLEPPLMSLLRRHFRRVDPRRRRGAAPRSVASTPSIHLPPEAPAAGSRLSTPQIGHFIGESRSLDSALAAAALLAEKELGGGSSYYSFPFTRSDCSNLPISLSNAAESLPWPSRIEP